jgi:hypothetical protein
MDKVRLKLTRNELVYLSDYLCDMVTEHNNVIRNAKAEGTELWSNTGKRFAINMRCATLALLSIRLQTARFMVRRLYKVNIPVNEGFALLSVWVERHSYATDHRVMVQPIIARIDQALA